MRRWQRRKKGRVERASIFCWHRGHTFTPTAKLFSSNAAVVYLRSSPTHAGHLWLARGGDLQRSTDGGVTCSVVEPVAEAGMVSLGAAAPGADEAAIYVRGLREGEESRACHRSIDGGATWTASIATASASAILVDSRVSPALTLPSDPPVHPAALAFDPLLR